MVYNETAEVRQVKQEIKLTNSKTKRYKFLANDKAMYMNRSRGIPALLTIVFTTFSTFCYANDMPAEGLIIEVKLGKNKSMTVANTARPGEVAIKEEYDAAIAANTEKALALFIARHPKSKWTADAQKRLLKVRSK